MSAAKCPICGKPRDETHKPFCSKRCGERDLARWLSEAYAIPAADLPEEEEEARPPPDPDKETFH